MIERVCEIELWLDFNREKKEEREGEKEFLKSRLWFDFICVRESETR